MGFLMNTSVALVRHFWEELIRRSNSISILRLDNDLKTAIVTWLCGISKLSKAERIFLLKINMTKRLTIKRLEKTTVLP